MYENKNDELAPLPVFYSRVLRGVLFALGILAVCLLIGILGYHYIAGIEWIDSLHNASMILSGMGPVVTIDNNAGKIFSSCYALFSGVIFITNVGIILAPAAHRLFHKLHIDDDDDK